MDKLEKIIKYKLVDDEYDIEYGVFDTKQEAIDYRKTKRIFCIWTNDLIQYRIIEIKE